MLPQFPTDFLRCYRWMTMTDPKLSWNDGEQEEFRGTLGTATSFSYYVPPEEQARLADQGHGLSEGDWKALIDKSAFYRDMLVLHAAPSLVVSLLMEGIEGSPSAYIPLKGALAELGDEVIPLALRRLQILAEHAEDSLYAKPIAAAVSACVPVFDPSVAPILELLETSRAKRQVKRPIAAWRERHARPTGDNAAPPSGFRHIGMVTNNDHPATPLVVGDFATMKYWPGNPDGDLEQEATAVADGTVVGLCAADMAGANVFMRDARVVILFEVGSYGRETELSESDARAALTASPESDGVRFPLEIGTGAVVIAVQGYATPEVGAAVDHLEELAYFDGCPRLPAAIPTSVSRLVSDQEQYLTGSLIIPLPPGDYLLTGGPVEGFERYELAPAT